MNHVEVVRPLATGPLAELGPRLAARRAELNLSVREAAAAAAVPPATFSRVENGRRPGLKTFRRLVAWLGIPPETFFESMEAVTSTPAVIAEHLRADPALPPGAVDKIAEVERLAQAQAEAASEKARADHYASAWMALAQAVRDRDEQLDRARALAADVLAQVWAHPGPPPEMAGAVHRLWLFAEGRL